MKEYQSLSHTIWDCKYHVVFIPKRSDAWGVAQVSGEIFRELVLQRESQVGEGYLMHSAEVCGIACGGVYQVTFDLNQKLGYPKALWLIAPL